MKRLPSILLREYGDPVLAELTTEEAAALQDAGAGLDVRVTRTPGRYELRAANKVGTVVLPGRTLRILPKVPVNRLVHLLGFSTDLIEFGGHDQAEEASDVVTAMKVLYAEALTRALSRGLLRSYRDDEQDLSTVRGRVDAKALYLRRFGQMPPVRCRFQEYDVDTEANRRLLAAAYILSRAGARTDRGSALLSRLCSRFEGVSWQRYHPETLEPVARTRLMAQYEPALSMAEAILRNASLELPPGTTGAVAFIVDMNRVYERFAAQALREAIGLSRRQWDTQAGGLHIDERRRLPMIPDVLVRGLDGVPLLVLDTKYKVVERAPPGDVHQVIAYCSALGIKEAVLLYASCPDETHVVRHSGVRVHQWQLAIGGEIEDVDRQVRSVGLRLSGLIEGIHDGRAEGVLPLQASA
jgi:5-methylcytosine-specific restriction enzyme subunit McrC